MMLPTLLENACPHCNGDLHFTESTDHPDRNGYAVHTYSCKDCGPIIYVTSLISGGAWHISSFSPKDK